jgi:hypothetical protein
MNRKIIGFYALWQSLLAGMIIVSSGCYHARLISSGESLTIERLRSSPG